MQFEFLYQITYMDGREYTSKNNTVTEISKEEYKRIVLGALKNIPISEIEGISEALKKMREQVLFIDRWKTLDGTSRKTALKKSRPVSHIEFFLCPRDRERFRQSKDLVALLDREEEHMRIYRNDGSFVEISAEFGKVKVKDSRDTCSWHIMEADYFISRIL